jgi:hypothetical protein
MPSGPQPVAAVSVNGYATAVSPVVIVLGPGHSRDQAVQAERLVREWTGREPYTWMDATGTTTVAAPDRPPRPHWVAGDGLHQHGGLAAHSHEVRPDHGGVPAAPPPGHAGGHSAEGPAGCARCQFLRDNAHWMGR